MTLDHSTRNRILERLTYVSYSAEKAIDLLRDSDEVGDQFRLHVENAEGAAADVRAQTTEKEQ